jgi:hypothetical protein
MTGLRRKEKKRTLIIVSAWDLIRFVSFLTID